jgi:hypothetical protein
VRKSLSIVLIILLLFNVLGYYGLFIGLRYQNSQDLLQRLDHERYAETETVTIKIPLAIPYASDDKDFERVDGEFEYNGEFYRLVKQRLQHDTLFLVCLKDQGSKRIHKALADYVKTFTDKPVNAKHGAKGLPSFIKEYLSTTCPIKHASLGWGQPVYATGISGSFVDSFCSSIIHPPERA